MPEVFHLDAPTRERVAATIATALEAEADVVFAYLHGSFVESGGFRDIDLAVFLDGPVDRVSARGVDLATRLSDRIGFPVDARPLNQAPLAFRFHVFHGGRSLFSRDDERLADLIEQTVRDYLDIAPLLRRATVEAFGA